MRLLQLFGKIKYKVQSINWRGIPYQIKAFYFDNGIVGWSSLFLTGVTVLVVISGGVINHNQQVANRINTHNEKVKSNTFNIIDKYKGHADKYLMMYTKSNRGNLVVQLKAQGTTIEKLNAKTKDLETDQELWKLLNPIGDKIIANESNTAIKRDEKLTDLTFQFGGRNEIEPSDFKSPILFIQVNPNNKSQVELAKKWIENGKKNDFKVRLYDSKVDQSKAIFLEGLYRDIFPGGESAFGYGKQGYDETNTPTNDTSAYFLKDANLYGDNYESLNDLPTDGKFPTISLQKGGD